MPGPWQLAQTPKLKLQNRDYPNFHTWKQTKFAWGKSEFLALWRPLNKIKKHLHIEAAKWSNLSREMSSRLLRFAQFPALGITRREKVVECANRVFFLWSRDNWNFSHFPVFPAAKTVLAVLRFNKEIIQNIVNIFTFLFIFVLFIN